MAFRSSFKGGGNGVSESTMGTALGLVFFSQLDGECWEYVGWRF